MSDEEGSNGGLWCNAKCVEKMPTLYLHTNIPVDGLLTSDILQQASAAVARILGKPEKYVMVLLEGGVAMRCCAVEEPAAWGELVSIGGLGREENEDLSEAIAGILEAKLCVPNLRFQIHFQDVKQDPCSDHVSCLHVIHQ